MYNLSNMLPQGQSTYVIKPQRLTMSQGDLSVGPRAVYV